MQDRAGGGLGRLLTCCNCAHGVCTWECMCLCVLVGGPVRQREPLRQRDAERKQMMPLQARPASSLGDPVWGHLGPQGTRNLCLVTQYGTYSPWRCLRTQQLWAGEEGRVGPQGVGSDCGVPSLMCPARGGGLVCQPGPRDAHLVGRALQPLGGPSLSLSAAWAPCL